MISRSLSVGFRWASEFGFKISAGGRGVPAACEGSRNSKRVHGTDDAHRPFVENMRVDHRGLDVGVAEQRLHGADVLARLLYHLSVEEDHGIERLILSGCGYLIFYG